MSKPRSLTVNEDTFNRFNGLRIRIATSRNNRIPTVMRIISALIELGVRHYDELLSIIGDAEDSE
jgi:hypothetical protein